MGKLVGFIFLSLSVAVSFGQHCSPPVTACDSNVCFEPDCACAGSQPAIPVRDLPQLVYLTFDDSLTPQAHNLYLKGLFDGTFTNPNGCPIKATHYVTHQYNDYSLNHLYYTWGHEFASHSITHRTNITYWRTMNSDQWMLEMAGVKEMMGLYAGIPASEIVGLRAPFLQGGGDLQFDLMRDNGFTYDCSMPSKEYGYTNMANGIWPYSLDHPSGLKCDVEPCPTCSYPGVWAQPMLSLEDMRLGVGGAPDVGASCSMLDGCVIPQGNDPLVVKEMLMKNFVRAHGGNTRAPFGLYMHAAWFFTTPDWRYEGYKMFLQEITTNPLYNRDTWIVTVRDGINFRKDPVPLSVLLEDRYEPFWCEDYPVYDCVPKSCDYYGVLTEDFEAWSINMRVCGECPPHYPWLGDPAGLIPKERT